MDYYRKSILYKQIGIDIYSARHIMEYVEYWEKEQQKLVYDKVIKEFKKKIIFLIHSHINPSKINKKILKYHDDYIIEKQLQVVLKFKTFETLYKISSKKIGYMYSSETDYFRFPVNEQQINVNPYLNNMYGLIFTSYLITPIRLHTSKIKTFYWEDCIPESNVEMRYLFALYSHMDECISKNSYYRFDPFWEWQNYMIKILKHIIHPEF